MRSTVELNYLEIGKEDEPYYWSTTVSDTVYDILYIGDNDDITIDITYII